MIILGVLSDTHLSGSGACVPEWVRTAFTGVDAILHAGDSTVPEVIEDLETIAPCHAVRGNMDGWECRYPFFRIFTWEGHCVVLAHRLEEAYRQAPPGQEAILVFGHTHVSEFTREGPFWLLNPGSPSSPRAKKPPSVALLELGPGKVHATFKVQPRSTD